MKKVTFSPKELNKFLLFGDNNSYIIDKINPLIRAVKRQNFLAIFCTLRFNEKTTTVKLGNFPETELDEIYTKFDIAYKISKNGNNPNFIFSTLKNKKQTNLSEQELNISFLTIQNLFFNENKLNKKYKLDFSNTIKKNLGIYFLEPIKSFDEYNIRSIFERLKKENKHSTARNMLNYLYTLTNFALKNENCGILSKKLLKILKNIKNLKEKKLITANQTEIKKLKKEISNKIRKLNIKQLKNLNKNINNYLD